jgi:hypothetical protein
VGADGVARGVGPEFKPKYHKKQSSYNTIEKKLLRVQRKRGKKTPQWKKTNWEKPFLRNFRH